MAKACTANFVDRLLVKLDGALCPIWNSLFFSVEELPSEEILFATMNLLIDEAPRLKSVWSEQKGGWQEIKPDERARAAAFQFDAIVRDRNERIHQLIKTPLVLTQGLPLLVSVGKTTCNKGNSWLIGFQIHHAAGDGRSLIHMIQRYWDLLNQALHQGQSTSPSLQGPQMSDSKILKKLWPYKRVLPYLVKAKYRQLSRRGDALEHAATTIGAPCIQSCRVTLPQHQPYNSSEIFYSGILAAIIKSEKSGEDKLIRIRLPVDLRHFLAIPANSVENGCSAVVLEFSLKTLREVYLRQPQKLGLVLREALSNSLKEHIYLINAVECMVASRLTQAKTLKKAAQEELLAKKRSSTMVVTHFGDITKYIRPPASIKVLNIQTHTPVWGSNSIVYDGVLFLTVTSFNGIWNTEQIHQFSTKVKDWIGSLYGLSGEML